MFKSILALALIILSQEALTASPRPAYCTFTAVATVCDPTPQFEDRGVCGIIDAEGLRLSSATLAILSRDASGLGTVLVHDAGWYYVTADGDTANVLTFDNGPDSFSDGLVRTWRGGKVVFLDRALTPAIATAYDFAWPFESGRAVVCIGCTIGTPDDDGHSPVRGGLWGRIDTTGKEVVPIRYTRDELTSFE